MKKRRGRKPAGPGRTKHAPGGINRPESPALEGIEPMPEELTGLASGSGADLESLFDSDTSAHLADGFRGDADEVADPEVSEEDVRRVPKDRTLD